MRQQGVKLQQLAIMSSDLTSATRPVTDATLTVRVIKSFKYRTEKSLVLHHIDLTQTTVRDLKNIAKRGHICFPFIFLSPCIDTL